MTASQDISRLKMIGEIDPPTTGGAAATRSTLTGESGWRGGIDLPELNESPDWSLGGKQTTTLLTVTSAACCLVSAHHYRLHSD